MSQKFSREELYDLVWAKPMKILASEFGLSDVGIAKVCKKLNIPKPPRGYWARKAAGKSVRKLSLPARSPGMSQDINIGGSKYGQFYGTLSDTELLASEPTPPVFNQTIEEVKISVEKLIKKVGVPKFPDKAHRLIRKLLVADEERRIKYESSSYKSIFDEPFFITPFEKRRLKVLNAICTALEIAGMKPSIRGKEARELSVQINDTYVKFSLDAASPKYKRNHWKLCNPERSSDDLYFSINKQASSDEIWRIEDGKGSDKLEKHLREIIVQLIIEGEKQYRLISQSQFEWLVQRKANLIEQIERQKKEDEEKERLRIVALEKANIDKLIADADAMKTASYIRQYIHDLHAHFESGLINVSVMEFEKWSKWANEQADRIDPIKSGDLIKTIKGDIPI